jgi:hypothetical protein
LVNIDADPRNADWIQVMTRARKFAGWTKRGVDAECAKGYRAYTAEVRERHKRYFNAHPERLGGENDFGALDRAAALPLGSEHLANALPAQAWHRHHLSGPSSQVVAIALLAAAESADPSRCWLPHADTCGEPSTSLFELEVAPFLLNEHPRQTSLDYLVTGDTGVVAVEAKFTEQGFGTCSCKRRVEGICSSRVLERPYWKVAQRELDLLRLPEQKGCPLSLAYQPVRNIAAAAAIAGPERQAAFVLLYDERNPHFTGYGRWKGWVDVLASHARYSTVAVASLSWQQLLDRVDVGSVVRTWASEKHGLEAATPT